VEKPGVKVALEMLRQEFDLALGAELGQSMNEFRKAREEIDRGSSTIPELNLLCLFTRQVAAETSAPATGVGTQGKNLWRRVWPTDYGKLASRTDARTLQPPEQSLRLPEKARNPDRRGRPRSNPDILVLPDFGIVGTCPMFF
jgi:hypothetical protein